MKQQTLIFDSLELENAFCLMCALKFNKISKQLPSFSVDLLTTVHKFQL